MNRRVMAGVAAVVLAVLGTLVLVNYVNRAEDRALEGERTVNVFVVSKRIPAGTPGAEIASYVAESKIPEKVRAETAVADLAALEGRIASIDLTPGEQLVIDRFVEPRDFDATPSRIGVPAGKLEVTVGLDPQRALGGRVRPGDRVAVFLSFEPFDMTGASVTVNGEEVPLPEEVVGAEGRTPNVTRLGLQRVLVTEVQTEDEIEDGESVEASTDIDNPTQATSGDVYVTLALDPDAAERVIFTQEYGTIWLANEPEPADKARTGTISRGNVLNGSGSAEDTGAPTAEEPSQ
ncbi:MAG TPA: RcpC/CpaB family pilus assembly protein [Microthrixaceae bacterium]|nr:RcpC/CpaB family pilus assembly protein [Microthrixaceae bacterium]